MIRVRVVLGGIGNGLLMNRMPPETLEQIRTKTSPPKRRDISHEEEATPKLYVDDDGNLGIPSLNLYASLVEAGREVAYKGRSKVSTATSTKLYAFFEIEEEFLLMLDDPEWKVDRRRGVNPNGGEATCLIRPFFPEWRIEVTVRINQILINEKSVQDLFRIAGTQVGLGDFRPQKRGPFGRFEVAVWEVLEGPSKDEEAALAPENGEVDAAAAEKAVASTSA